MSHAPIPPSSAGIWSNCTAWPQMAEAFPQEDTEDTLIGEAVHEIGALDIIKHRNGGVMGEYLVVESLASNGITVTDEMIEAAEIYSDDVIGEYDRRIVRGGCVLMVEEQIKCKRIHPEHSYGTPDAVLWAPADNLLILWDYKNGHLYVDPFENKQSINYLAGLIDEFGIGEEDPVDIEVRIVQPHCYSKGGPIRVWKTTVPELIPHIERLSIKAITAMSGEGNLVAGSHCRRCQARHGCEAYLRYGIDLYTCVMEPSPMHMSEQAMGMQLLVVEQAMEALKGLQTGYQAQIESLIKGGKVVPWWSMQPSSGRESWSAPVETVAAIGEMFGKKLVKDKPVTPGQARKLGIPAEIVEQYSSRKVGLQLVRDDNRGASRVFKGE